MKFLIILFLVSSSCLADSQKLLDIIIKRYNLETSEFPDYTYSNIIPFIISGESMYPTYLDGDKIYINKSISFFSLKEGDIVVYIIPKHTQPDQYIAHRIIKKEGNSFICKGDKNLENDKVVLTQNNYVGKVIR